MLNVFEYPFVGIALAVLSMIALWIYHAFKPDKKKRWHFLVPFIIAGAAFAIAFLVQTDREKIRAAINKGINAFKTQQIEPIREIIADDYSDAAHGSKELILAYCQALFQTAMVQDTTMLSRKTEVADSRGSFTAETLVRFTEDSQIAQMGKPAMLVKMRFNFKKTPDKKWLIDGSELLEIDRKAIDWKQLAGM